MKGFKGQGQSKTIDLPIIKDTHLNSPTKRQLGIKSSTNKGYPQPNY